MISRHLQCAARYARTFSRALLMSLFLVACGGGVESGGTGGNATASYVSGPITGFGSVIVGDVRFDDTSASVSDADGAVRGRDDLKLGMTIHVRGTPISDEGSSTATSIVYGSAIVGPISEINAGAGTLAVLGQQVEVVATTVFDTSLAGAVSALAIGDVIEVYALFDAATQRFRATRIERKPLAAVYLLRGVVTNLNANAQTFMIGTERISYAALPAGLTDGSIVRVDLQPWLVSGLRPSLTLANGVVQPQNHDEVRIEGLINRFGSIADFAVDGVPVDASGASFPDGTVGLMVGARVALRGLVDNGVLSASRVQIKSQAQVQIDGFQLRGPISNADPATQTFVLRGVTVDYSGSPEYKGGGSQLDLVVTANVEVRGTLSGDGTRLVATRITFRR